MTPPIAILLRRNNHKSDETAYKHSRSEGGAECDTPSPTLFRSSAEQSTVSTGSTEVRLMAGGFAEQLVVGDYEGLETQ